MKKANKAEKLQAMRAARAGMLHSESIRNKVEQGNEGMHLAAVLARRMPEFTPWEIALDAALLRRIGRQLAGLALAQCNYGLSQRQETRRENLAKQAAEVAGWYGLHAHAYGDPRGYVLRLDGPDMPRNGMGDGFGVA